MSGIVSRWLTGAGGTRFFTQTYSATRQKAVLVFCHGFIEHIERYQHVFPVWADRGITVLAFDQRGFGRTALDEEKSKDSVYGKSSLPEQMADVEWAVSYAKNELAGGKPVFLMGHSMGGAIVLGYATRSPPMKTVSSLAGVIASSPLLCQTKPAPKILRWVGGQASKILPNLTFKAEVNSADLTHDPVVNDSYSTDPLVYEKGTLRQLRDMLNHGEQLLWNDYKDWPKDLPVLLIHGTEDKVTSCKSTEEFFQNLPAQDKKLSLYPGGYHELHNEPDGVKEKFIEECISWVEAHLPAEPSPSPAAAVVGPAKL
ncbi:lysophospholipase [Punctularia strigosozonata HHB-11173 SS5]|uniref:lysophospholipase n=1 Tax=Punctularia strigosozonata (strain HHB-11173) TaxID=741275 RepID=UPI0004417B8D|nr:lysophospholipase [Punctularia strigosozonata HHB-11173 SS5]EIN06778.1 lysophospholipase [Punctularia strigosozonata HHB-11173 SS5]